MCCKHTATWSIVSGSFVASWLLQVNMSHSLACFSKQGSSKSMSLAHVCVPPVRYMPHRLAAARVCMLRPPSLAAACSCYIHPMTAAVVGEHDILAHNPAAGLLRPAFAVVKDTTTRQVILCVRGTHSRQDMFTSLTGEQLQLAGSLLLHACRPAVRLLVACAESTHAPTWLAGKRCS